MTTSRQSPDRPVPCLTNSQTVTNTKTRCTTGCRFQTLVRAVWNLTRNDDKAAWCYPNYVFRNAYVGTAPSQPLSPSSRDHCAYQSLNRASGSAAGLEVFGAVWRARERSATIQPRNGGEMWRGYLTHWRCCQNACSHLGSSVQEVVRPSRDPEKMARIAARVNALLAVGVAADNDLLHDEGQEE